MTAMGRACVTIIAGLMSMPMVTKKIALNMSRMGSMRCSIFLSSRDSAMIAPMRNAPSAML